MSRTGWAAGTTDSGKWLTIRGSAHTRPVLHQSREAAEQCMGLAPAWVDLAVALVTETWHGGVSGDGYAYWITPGTLSRPS